MRKYFIHDGHEKKGPFNLEELKGLQLKKEMLVWHEGLTEWIKAGDVEDLNDYFAEKIIPPPLPKTFEINTLLRDKVLSSFEEAAETYHEPVIQKRSSLFPIIITIVILLGIIAAIYFYH